MLSIVATLTVKEDKVEEAKAFLKEIRTETLANEPGTLAYVAHQREDDPATFVIYEKYESEEAFSVHGKNLVAKGPRFAALLAGRPEIVRLEEL